MRCAAVYYSLTGHCRFLAQKVQEELGCEQYEVKLHRPYSDSGFSKYYRAGRDTSLRWPVSLVKPLPDLKAYEAVIIVTPVWAGRVSSPLYSFLRQTDLQEKKLFIIASCSGGDTQKCFKSIEKLVRPAHVVDTISFIDPTEAHFTLEQQRTLRSFLDQIRG
jgi:flavodoxin